MSDFEKAKEMFASMFKNNNYDFEIEEYEDYIFIYNKSIGAFFDKDENFIGFS